MENNRSYVTGIIGAIIGGLICSIPWILLYVYANFIFSVCATIVAIGALKGYQLFKGKIGKPLPIIIAVVSMLSITVATLIIIPALLLLKEGATLSIQNMQLLYGNSDFVGTIFKDYAVSVLFTLLGISGTIRSINMQVKKNNETIETPKIINPTLAGDLMFITKKDLDKIRIVFEKYNAFSEENTIDEDTLKNELQKKYKDIKRLLRVGIVIEKDNKYYYDTNREKEIINKIKKNNKSSSIAAIVTIVTVVVLIFITIIMGSNNSSKSKTKEYNDSFLFLIKDEYKEYKDDKVDKKYYYVPKKDLSTKSGYIIVVFDNQLGSYNNDEELKDRLLGNLNNTLAESGDTSGNLVEFYDSYDSITNNKVMRYIWKSTDSTVYIYYVIKDNKFIYIAAQDYNIEGIDIKKTADKIAEFYKF